MIVFGPVSVLLQCNGMINFTVYGFTSLSDNIEKLNLIPPHEIVTASEYEFDMIYANYIFGNDLVFNDFMKIINSLYYGDDVFIAISPMSSPFIENLNESLAKLIQQRYGYNVYRINCWDDIDSIMSSWNKQESFSINGLFNLDADKDRIAQIFESSRLKSGGVPYE